MRFLYKPSLRLAWLPEVSQGNMRSSCGRTGSATVRVMVFLAPSLLPSFAGCSLCLLSTSPHPPPPCPAKLTDPSSPVGERRVTEKCSHITLQHSVSPGSLSSLWHTPGCVHFWLCSPGWVLLRRALSHLLSSSWGLVASPGTSLHP